MLAADVDCIQYQGNASMEARIDEILRSYGARLSTEDNVKPLSIYILTDGVWALRGDGPETPIVEIISILSKGGYPREQLGIQFIGFGENREGLEQMQRIDTMSDPGSGFGLDL